TFRSLHDAWADTTTSHGRLILTVLGGLAEFERQLIVARTSEGRKRAQALGVLSLVVRILERHRAERDARRVGIAVAHARAPRGGVLAAEPRAELTAAEVHAAANSSPPATVAIVQEAALFVIADETSAIVGRWQRAFLVHERLPCAPPKRRRLLSSVPL